jgi:hypothetical protein
LSRARSTRTFSPLLFLAAGAVLLPWAAWLVVSLPSTQTAHHWDLAWAGFDVGLAAALLAAGRAARRRAPSAGPAAIVAATLLACDAWFDILTSRGVAELAMSGAQALVVELPLAVLCLRAGLGLTAVGGSTKPIGRLDVPNLLQRHRTRRSPPPCGSGPAFFLFAPEDGTISGWNPYIDARRALIAVDSPTVTDSAGDVGAVYKGLAVVTSPAGNFLLCEQLPLRRGRRFREPLQPGRQPQRSHDPAGAIAPFGIQHIDPVRDSSRKPRSWRRAAQSLARGSRL